MSSRLPEWTEQQKQQYRRYFAALREHNQREREWKRHQVVDPAHAREVGDMLWQLVRERFSIIEGDTDRDDEAEARVARAILAVGAHRSARQSA